MSIPKLRTDNPQAFLMSRLSTRSVMEFPVNSPSDVWRAGDLCWLVP